MESGIPQQGFNVGAVAVAARINQSFPVLTGQHDQAAVEIKPLLQRLHDKLQQTFYIQDIGHCLPDLLHQKGVVVTDGYLIEKTVGGVTLPFRPFINVFFLQIL
ncbi:MAG: hypothetical protein A4E66_02175 [Syntrophus sp. PtaB.Bin001]|nr:MAG: hypothetical protein A4E66_02175 [Syntrophus sp. PtaB.Bin001]